MCVNENMNIITRIVTLIFLFNAMQSSVTQTSTYEKDILYYNTNSTEATLNSARHHASIRLKEHDQRYGDGHICSGVVIGSSVVLTTAQCVYNYNKNKLYHPAELKIVLASISRYQHQQQTLIFDVTHSYHPDTFNALTLRDNVAILMLDRAIAESNNYVKPINLPNAQTYHPNWYEKQNGGQLKLTTWLETNKGLTLNNLMLLNVSKMSDENCSHYNGTTFFSWGMLCLKTNESLSKDLGAPLYVDNILVGLKSSVLDHSGPAIFTDVLHHLEWIHKTIGDGSNQNSSIWGILGLLLLTLVTIKRTKFSP